MIELPEGLVLADQLNTILKSKIIIHITANASPHKFAWFYGQPEGYDALLSGRIVEGAYSYGGKVHIRLSGNGGFMFCEGISLRYYAGQSQLPKKHQLCVEFDDTSFLVCTVQMYGGIYGYEGTLINEYDDVARTKPSVLSDEFSLAYFKSLFPATKRKFSAKAFLATEQRIPGLGNGVLQDILFNAGLSPRHDIAALTQTEWETLYTSVKNTISEMTACGGRDTEKNLYGNTGGYRTLMSKQTYQHPCPKCAGIIQKEAFMGGSVYYCPVCQI